MIGSNSQKRVGQNVTLGHINGVWVLRKGYIFSQLLSSLGPKTPINQPESRSKLPTLVSSFQKFNQNSDFFPASANKVSILSPNRITLGPNLHQSAKYKCNFEPLITLATMAKIENFLWPSSSQRGQDSREKSFFDFDLF